MLDFNIRKFYELLIYRHKQNIEDKIYDRWVIGGYDKEISLDEFKQKLTGTKKETNNKEETNNKINKLTSEEIARLNRLDI